MFGPPVGAYIQYCIQKMLPPLVVFGAPCCEILAMGLNKNKKFMLRTKNRGVHFGFETIIEY